ncbi:MAG: inositol monophosphatase, partial [Deltaproteobacteria bacterium]|nr:inositol monophosphatase [Deltaproteobacteria bacterium]
MSEAGIEARHLATMAIAQEAGDLARRHFLDRDAMAITFKGPQDWLTEADRQVEDLVTGRIRAAFPGDACVGEESGGTEAGSVWVIDPIDGTSNFARGVPHFCISIAYMRDRRIESGAIYNPITGEMFAARRGRGAWCNGRTMKVSAIADFKRATIELGWSTRRGVADYTALLTRVVGAGASFRRAGSGALGMAYVADGRNDGYAELHINVWDVLAGILMVVEAGGWTNDFLAGDGFARGNAILAGAPGIKKELMAAAA